MAGDYSILVGTTGAGLFHSPDSGQTWSRIGAPFPGESQIRALAVDPGAPTWCMQARITASTAAKIPAIAG